MQENVTWKAWHVLIIRIYWKGLKSDVNILDIDKLGTVPADLSNQSNVEEMMLLKR